MFAAYSDANKTDVQDAPATNEWLSNSSFQINATEAPTKKTGDAIATIHPKHLKDNNNAETETGDAIIHPKHLKDNNKAATQTGDATIHPKHSKDNDNNGSSSLDKAESKRKHKRRKRKHKRHKSDVTTKQGEKCDVNANDNFKIDTNRVIEYLTVPRIARPSAPRCRIDHYIDKTYRDKRIKFKRYYQVVPQQEHDEVKKVSDEVKKVSDKEAPSVVKEGETSAEVMQTDIQEEAEMTKTTAYYNRMLADDPRNIDMWLKYVNFQDTIFQFEKSYRKGSIAKGQRVTAERKLSILDKAISYNANCEILLRARLDVAVSVYPFDELQEQLQRLVEKDRGNIILWQGYIEATQCSMSHCSAPSVINLYIKCLHTLHTMRRTAKLRKAQLEENILRMLYQCGLFLKQAGLFEQLWTLLRLYLELNLSPSNENTFNLRIFCNDKQLEELEDIILGSQLPIHELWLRVEKLREACHWMPLNEEVSQDPQRIVFPEDVSELIHPITMRGNTFKLIVTILTLLKVPLIPCRHTAMKEFGIDYVPWALDSIETLLPIFLPEYPLHMSHKFLSTITQRLTIAPQYLKTLPGQEEYLQFLLTVMMHCIECTNGLEKTALLIWWMRFQRLLVNLEKADMLKLTNVFKKKLRTDIKSILKENPTNAVLFKEYALLEHDSGKCDSAVNVLKTTLNATLKGRCLTQISDDHERAAICAAFRCLIELTLFASLDFATKKQICLKYCIVFMQGKDLNELPRFVTQTALGETSNTFTESTSHFLDTYTNGRMKLHGAEHFLPNIITDWIICNAWFLYLSDSFDACRIFIENTLKRLDDVDKGASWHKEVLNEFLVAVLYKDCVEQPASGLFRKLDAILLAAVECYPNNLFLLATLSRVQSINITYGESWWKIRSLLLKTGHALSTIFLVLIANQQFIDIQENYTDTITGETLSLDNSFKNRMLSLFRRITSGDMCTRRCGLVWRLYLQFLHMHFDPKRCRNVYYAAVEECPWLKGLYLDAAVYIPEELIQIQDLIIEKQLRIHVTPEELDVLRN